MRKETALSEALVFAREEGARAVAGAALWQAAAEEAEGALVAQRACGLEICRRCVQRRRGGCTRAGRRSSRDAGGGRGAAV